MATVVAILDDKKIAILARNQRIKEEIPELAAVFATTEKPGCSPCQRRNVMANKMNQARAIVAQLSAEKKTLVKKILGVTQLKVKYRLSAVTNKVLVI